MILVVASSPAELQGIEQFPLSESGIRRLPNGESIVAVAVGIGKVNAALGTAQALALWSPSLLIGIGTCGAIRQDLQIGDIVLPKQIIQYDIDLRRFGWPRGSMQSLEGRVEGALTTEDLVNNLSYWKERRVHASVVLGTADIFLVAEDRAREPWIREELGIDVVDMESYAMVKAAKQARCAVAIVRVVSDSWRGNRPKNYQKFLSACSVDIFSLLAQYNEPSEKSPIIL